MRHLSEATDVLDTILRREAEITVDAMPHVVAVKQIGVMAERVQPAFNQVCDGGLAGAGQAGEPQAQRLLSLAGGAHALVDVDMLPVHIGRSAQRKVRSEEHTSELQSLMRISYAVFCLKKKTNTTTYTNVRS